MACLIRLYFDKNSASRRDDLNTMSPIKLISIAGFAMFSMFFGSGNLVFPLMIGVEAQGAYHYAAMGLLLTGVLVPFLGLIGMLFSSGNRHVFFAPLGSNIGFLITLIMLCLLGPFAVVPRCTIVAHGGFSLIAPDVKPSIYNAVFLLATMAMAWKKTRIIDIIGTYLTPLLLGGIVLIIVCGLMIAPPPILSTQSPQTAFLSGISQGYQTMDLLAAFFFSATTVAFIAKHLKTHDDKKKLESYGITACLIGAFLLATIYIGFVALGAKFSPVLLNVTPEKILVVIAVKALGEFALPIAATVIGLACLTTAAILTSLFVDFIFEDIVRKKLSRTVVLSLTIFLSYSLSLIGFGPLAKWIVAIVSYVYPALIVFTSLEILRRKTSSSLFSPIVSKFAFLGTVISMIVYRLI